MSYLIIELETQLLKTGKTSADLIRARGILRLIFQSLETER